MPVHANTIAREASVQVDHQENNRRSRIRKRTRRDWPIVRQMERNGRAVAVCMERSPKTRCRLIGRSVEICKPCMHVRALKQEDDSKVQMVRMYGSKEKSRWNCVLRGDRSCKETATIDPGKMRVRYLVKSLIFHGEYAEPESLLLSDCGLGRPVV